MLQWMGDSRRKVTTTRKSTQKRQKQYFEQRKRQQQNLQIMGLESSSDVLGISGQYLNERRSLDILNLLNLSTNAQECYSPCVEESADAGVNMSTMPGKILKNQPTVFSSMATPVESSRIEDARIPLVSQMDATQKKVLVSAPDYQDGALSGIPCTSTNSKTVVTDQYVGLSVIDLLYDDGPKITVEEHPTFEDHVAFSLEGLSLELNPLPFQIALLVGSFIKQLVWVKLRQRHHLNHHNKQKADRKLNEIEPEDNQIKAFQEQERQKVHELLDQYVLTLTLAGVEANKILIKMDSIEKGILHAIAEHNIKWLVMGASGDIYRSDKLAEEGSKKAVIVFEQASVPCNIWFIHKGNLIYTSADSKDISEIETAPSLLVLSSNTGGKQYEISSECTPSSQKYLDAEKMEGMLINFSSHCSVESVKSSTKFTDLLSLEVGSDAQDDTREQDGRRELANVDARSFRSNEVVGAVESSNIEDNSTVLVEASKSLCANEVSRRRELEELYAREKLELQKVKDQQDEIMGKVRMIQDQNSALDGQVVESKIVVAELEEKILSAVELLIRFKDRRDKLKIEHLNAVRELNKLRNFVNADAEYPHGTEFPTFSFLEINEATNDFDPSWKIGEGRYGSVYKGLLHNMQVAIRMLPSYGCQSLLEFQHQVEVLSRVRHRNLVTLIGSCPESRSLVYDYLNNGSLEDHLARKDKTPLPWQIRISIAADICSALIFIHSCEPCIIHGNLKPSKILLDVNFVAKLCDLGFSSLVQFSGHPADSNKTVDKRNENLVYADPEFLTTGKLTPESDVYSFGIILLQLLTGRPLSGIVRDTKCALEKENLKAVLDISAGEWPLYQVEQLAYLALRCSKKTQLNRPDLLSEIWSLLRPLQTSCSNMSPYSTSKKLQRPPSHFVCPIFQEVMKDPYIAADGFTYEEDAIRGWLDSGHNTSPMTNLKLEHTNLVPNYALLNAIQEWQHLQ